jgi:hypothetical protein
MSSGAQGAASRESELHPRESSHCPPLPSSALPLRPETAPYLSRRGRSRRLRGARGPGMGQLATASPLRGRGGAPGPASLPPPPPPPPPPPLLQHRGQRPPAARRRRRRPPRPARSREPRILARPRRRRRRAALSPAQGCSAQTWRCSDEDPSSPRLLPPPPPSRLPAPCSLPRSRISPPGTPAPAPGGGVPGGAGREVWEPGGGGGTRGAQLESAVPSPFPFSPALLPPVTRAMRGSWVS